MSYEMGMKPLRQVQLSTLSPVMWSLKGGYPRKPMTVPIGRGMGTTTSDSHWGTMQVLLLGGLLFLSSPIWLSYVMDALPSSWRFGG
jgi:hypothetical protein